MTITDRALANLHRTTAWQAADACARLILGFASPRAVSIDPQGRVWVEPVEEACESDLVGVYDRSLGLFGLNRQLHDDLQHEWRLRRAVPQPRRLVRGKSAGRAAA